jgi:hypothetical protein
MDWIELIVIFGGIYLTLMAYSVIPIHSKDPEKAKLWHKKFGKLSKILGPIMVLFGVAKLFGIL